MARQNTTHTVKSKAKRSKLSPAAAKYLPRPDFPLSPHVSTRRWYKVIRGKRHYFGPLSDPDAALREWLEVRDELEAGLTPKSWQADTCRPTVGDCIEGFLQAKGRKAEAGRLANSTLASYHAILTDAAARLGANTEVAHLRPEKFERLANWLHANYSPSVTAKAIIVVRTAFKWAMSNRKIDAPVWYGSEFEAPSQADRRAMARSKGKQIYTAPQVRSILNAIEVGVVGNRWKPGNKTRRGIAPSVTMRAIILLGINGGMTQREVAGLTFSDIDLNAGIINTIRAKTKVTRTIPLWAETVDAIRESIAKESRDECDPAARLFVTRKGEPWVRDSLSNTDDPKRPGGQKLKMVRVDAIQLQFKKLTDSLNIKIPGAGFGHLRHTFRTVADEANDVHAAMRIMGHDLPGINSAYVRDISIDRLRAVTDYVRSWLFNVSS